MCGFTHATKQLCLCKKIIILLSVSVLTLFINDYLNNFYANRQHYNIHENVSGYCIAFLVEYIILCDLNCKLCIISDFS